MPRPPTARPEPAAGEPSWTAHPPARGPVIDHRFKDPAGVNGHRPNRLQPHLPGEPVRALLPAPAVAAPADVRVHLGAAGNRLLVVEPGRQRLPRNLTLHATIVVRPVRLVPTRTDLVDHAAAGGSSVAGARSSAVIRSARALATLDRIVPTGHQQTAAAYHRKARSTGCRTPADRSPGSDRPPRPRRPGARTTTTPGAGLPG
jgi:hypothetical protein